MSLEQSAESLRAGLTKINAAREDALRSSREVIQFSSRAIRAVHRGERDNARKMLIALRDVTEREDQRKELKVSWMSVKGIAFLGTMVLAGTFSFGLFSSRLHELIPGLFSLPSAFPYLDSLVMMASIASTYLMVQKKVECWLGWIMADVIATGLYFAKGILFVSMEYFIFCLIAAYGFWKWRKDVVSYKS